MHYKNKMHWPKFTDAPQPPNTEKQTGQHYTTTIHDDFEPETATQAAERMQRERNAAIHRMRKLFQEDIHKQTTIPREYFLGRTNKKNDDPSQI